MQIYSENGLKSKTSEDMSNQACSHFNRGFRRIENDHVVNGVSYMHCCAYCLKETGTKYSHPATKCLHQKNSQSSMKQDQVNTSKREQ